MSRLDDLRSERDEIRAILKKLTADPSTLGGIASALGQEPRSAEAISEDAQRRLTAANLRAREQELTEEILRIQGSRTDRVATVLTSRLYPTRPRIRGGRGLHSRVRRPI